jgi:hypothetical protein
MEYKKITFFWVDTPGLYVDSIWTPYGLSKNNGCAVKKDFWGNIVVFIPKLKNGNRRIHFMQHMQNVVAPNIFYPRIVYDARALAYSLGRPLLLAATF